MEKINEIKIPKGVESISVTQHDDRVVIEFMPKKPQFKNGDFVHEDGRIMIIKSYPNMCHALIYPEIDFNVLYNKSYAPTTTLSSLSFRYATDKEKQLLIDAMEKEGKRWNAEKLIVEDIPKPKFKVGDKVTLKKGYGSKNGLTYLSVFDEFVGKELTIDEYVGGVCVGFNETNNIFHEDWLEPYNEELKKGDLAIFWDNDDYIEHASIRMYDRKDHSGYYDSCGFLWDNAIKFESKEQFEKILRGEVK